jgi:hypothetical protein
MKPPVVNTHRPRSMSTTLPSTESFLMARSLQPTHEHELSQPIKSCTFLLPVVIQSSNYMCKCGTNLHELRLRRDPLAPDSWPDSNNFIKCLSPPWTGIWEAYALPFASDPFVGEGSCSLVGGVWTWLASCPSLASVDLVGARPLLAKQSLGESCHLRPALALLGGVASRQLVQPALWGRAGLLDLAPWRFLGRQPANSAALGIPRKSSPRQSSLPIIATHRPHSTILSGNLKDKAVGGERALAEINVHVVANRTSM